MTSISPTKLFSIFTGSLASIDATYKLIQHVIGACKLLDTNGTLSFGDWKASLLTCVMTFCQYYITPVLVQRRAKAQHQVEIAQAKQIQRSRDHRAEQEIMKLKQRLARLHVVAGQAMITRVKTKADLSAKDKWCSRLVREKQEMVEALSLSHTDLAKAQHLADRTLYELATAWTTSEQLNQDLSRVQTSFAETQSQMQLTGLECSRVMKAENEELNAKVRHLELFGNTLATASAEKRRRSYSQKDNHLDRSEAELTVQVVHLTTAKMLWKAKSAMKH